MKKVGIKTDKLNKTFTDFIQQQSLFFVATATEQGRVNVSPKGLDSLKVTSDSEIVWLSGTGSGNETAAHVIQNGRMTLMFCAFEGQHMILRVYGTAKVVHTQDHDWASYYSLFPDYAGARNIFCLQIELVTTAGGSGIPDMNLHLMALNSDGDDRTACVMASDLELRPAEAGSPNGVHFSAPALRELGWRYAQKYLEIDKALGN